MLSNMKRYADSLTILVSQCDLNVHFAPFNILAKNALTSSIDIITHPFFGKDTNNYSNSINFSTIKLNYFEIGDASPIRATRKKYYRFM